MMMSSQKSRLTAADLIVYQKRIPGAHVRGVTWIVLGELAMIVAIGLAVGAML